MSIAECFTCLGFAITLVGCGAMEEETRKGTQVLVFSLDEDLTVSIDGKQVGTITAPKFARYSVDPGAHKIKIGAREINLTLEAFDKWVVPIVDEQCFMSLDVGLSDYGASKKKAPSLVDPVKKTEPFKMPASHYLTKAKLPKKITAGTRPRLLRSTGCEKMAEMMDAQKKRLAEEKAG